TGKLGQVDDGGPAALDLGQYRQRLERDAEQRLVVRRGGHRSARSVAEEHPGAAARAPRGQLRLPRRRPVGHLRQPERLADGGDRAARSAEGRRLGRLWLGRGGGRDQHHHPPELPGPGIRRQLRPRRSGRAGDLDRQTGRRAWRSRNGRLQHPAVAGSLYPQPAGSGSARPDQERHLHRPARRPLERLVGQGGALPGRRPVRALPQRPGQCPEGMVLTASAPIDGLSGDTCAINLAPHTTLIPSTDRYQAYLFGTKRLTPQIEAFGEVLYSYVEGASLFGSSPFFTLEGGRFALNAETGLAEPVSNLPPANNPYKPYGVATPIEYTFFDLGRTLKTNESKSYRALAGVRGRHDRFDWEAAAFAS